MRAFIFAVFLISPVALTGAAFPAAAAKMSVAGNAVAFSRETIVSDKELNLLAAQAQADYQQITSILGRPGGEKFRVRVEEGVDVSYANHYRRTIVTGVYHLKNGQIPLAHELAHIITGHAASQLLSEGFAVYIQERVGKGRVFPNYGHELDARLRENSKRWNIPLPVNAYGFAARHLGDMEQMRKRIIAYHIAGSFCRYVIDTVLGGDVRKFMKIYYSGDYQAVTGKTRNEMIAAWRKAVLG